MQFYTNVRRLGNKILHRYVNNNGERYHDRVDFEPTLYITSHKETGWKTLKGISVEPKRFDSITDAKSFHDDVKDIRPDVVHGNLDYELQFIHEEYPDEIKFQFNKINIWFFDIEVKTSENVYSEQTKIRIREKKK